MQAALCLILLLWSLHVGKGVGCHLANFVHKRWYCKQYHHHLRPQQLRVRVACAQKDMPYLRPGTRVRQTPLKSQ